MNLEKKGKLQYSLVFKTSGFESNIFFGSLTNATEKIQKQERYSKKAREKVKHRLTQIDRLHEF